MNKLIGIAEISAALNVSHSYTRDRLVKRPDFPRPALSLSQKCRRWSKEAFEDWLSRETKKQSR